MIYKNKESSKVYKKWEDYEISLSQNVAGAIDSFKPVNR